MDPLAGHDLPALVDVVQHKLIPPIGVSLDLGLILDPIGVPQHHPLARPLTGNGINGEPGHLLDLRHEIIPIMGSHLRRAKRGDPVVGASVFNIPYAGIAIICRFLDRTAPVLLPHKLPIR